MFNVIMLCFHTVLLSIGVLCFIGLSVNEHDFRVTGLYWGLFGVVLNSFMTGHYSTMIYKNTKEK